MGQDEESWLGRDEAVGVRTLEVRERRRRGDGRKRAGWFVAVAKAGRQAMQSSGNEAGKQNKHDAVKQDLRKGRDGRRRETA